jgi:hypothetical protein
LQRHDGVLNGVFTHLAITHPTQLELIMDSTSLFSVCAIAFASVFTLLSFLAVAMHFITVLFPEPDIRTDPAVVAAISSSIATVIPGARVTNIREES